MLKINNNLCEIISEELIFTNAILNKVECYAPLINIKFRLNQKDGYITFYVGYMNNYDAKNLVNRSYKNNPYDMQGVINCLEIYDTKTFIDDVDSDVKVIFKDIVNNKIKTNFIIDDKLIVSEYDGLLNIVLPNEKR